MTAAKSRAPDFGALRRDALAVRRKLLSMHFEAHSGHIGSGLSCVEILVYAHRIWKKPEDRFILSKGHAASALYAVFNHVGLLSDADLGTYYKDSTLLPAHPAAGALEEVPAATGSLGHGLPIAAGLAFAHRKIRKSSSRALALLSDGECDEGSVWEAALFASHHQLDNLTAIVDVNGLQGFGGTRDVLNLEPLAAKWRAFGFLTREINGHDFKSIHAAVTLPRRRGDRRPLCLLARTVKGKGVRFMENRLEWHYLPMDEGQFKRALKDVEASR